MTDYSKSLILKPCPFCGGEPELRAQGEDFEHEICCYHCDITLMASAVDNLIEHWNTRQGDGATRKDVLCAEGSDAEVAEESGAIAPATSPATSTTSHPWTPADEPHLKTSEIPVNTSLLGQIDAIIGGEVVEPSRHKVADELLTLFSEHLFKFRKCEPVSVSLEEARKIFCDYGYAGQPGTRDLDIDMGLRAVLDAAGVKYE